MNKLIKIFLTLLVTTLSYNISSQENVELSSIWECYGGDRGNLTRYVYIDSEIFAYADNSDGINIPKEQLGQYYAKEYPSGTWAGFLSPFANSYGEEGIARLNLNSGEFYDEKAGLYDCFETMNFGETVFKTNAMRVLNPILAESRVAQNEKNKSKQEQLLKKETLLANDNAIYLQCGDQYNRYYVVVDKENNMFASSPLKDDINYEGDVGELVTIFSHYGIKSVQKRDYGEVYYKLDRDTLKFTQQGITNQCDVADGYPYLKAAALKTLKSSKAERKAEEEVKKKRKRI